MKTVMKKLALTSILACISFCFALGDQIVGGGNHHSLAVKEDGTVWAWGANDLGELGDGTTTTSSRSTPGLVTGVTDVISISAGRHYSLALKRDGTVWAWGENYNGQLGDGTGVDQYRPVQVEGLSGVIAVDGGYDQSLALKNDGTVWAWGYNNHGQLGDGTTSERWTPVQVAGLSEVIAVSAGGVHSLALKRDGTVWAWGWNYSGEVGDGTTTEHWTPVQVSELTDVISIAAGFGHSLALKRDGTVWAWGRNYYGQLGDGNGGGDYTNRSLTPVQSLVSGVIDIRSTDTHSLALTSYGTVWFWGSLLVDLHKWEYITEIIPVPVDSDVKAIASGGKHVMTLKNDGTVWALGNNVSGQLGDGTTRDKRYLVQVKGFSTDSSDPVINPDVKVNNVDGPLTVSAFTPITVTVQISPAYLGLDSDWWIAAKGGDSWFYLTLEDFLPKWTAMTDYTEMQPIYQGPLAPIGPVPIIESEYWLPRGDYEFFFAVDTLMDGLLTLEALHYDSALLTIQ